MINKAFTISNFILKHLIASVVSIATPTIALLIVYVVLILIALLTHSDLGSPIALPLWMIFIIGLSALYTAVLLFPTTLLAEIISRALRKWNHIAQIPISIFILLVFVYALSLMVHRYPAYSELNILHWADYPLVVFLVLTIPLGLYWWTMMIVQAGISLPIAFFGRSRRTR